MNTIADDTRQHGRAATATAATRSADVRSLGTQMRRLAGRWSADPQSMTFRAAIEHDRGLLRRVDGR